MALLKTLSESLRGKAMTSGPVELRPPARGDWKKWAELRSQSRSYLEPWEPTWTRDTLTRKAFARRLRAYSLNAQADTGYAFFIFRQDDSALVGSVSLNHVRRGVSQTGSVGYWTGEPFARKGYMTAALVGLLPFAFDTINLHRVSAACLSHNVASRTLLEKVGFSEEGFARKYLRINGSWQDHVMYAVLSTDPRPSLDSLPAPGTSAKSFASHIDDEIDPDSVESGVTGFARQE